ncbi:hypothetical protein [Pontibacter liquoris]|uniref:hypothetical protein n=1 Tax=Pontibacter liquoris TaxID=2905677 RepID=UPI001FA79F2C|nr:hypothetical protein [Pontibacter liquoris]
MKIRLSILLAAAIGLAFTSFNEGVSAHPSIDSSTGTYHNSSLPAKAPDKSTNSAPATRKNPAHVTR